MATGNPARSHLKPLPEVGFYKKYSFGPMPTPNGGFRDDLAQKGLMVDQAQLRLIKQDMSDRIRARIVSGVWKLDETFRGSEGV